jgi:hypothetical protein
MDNRAFLERLYGILCLEDPRLAFDALCDLYTASNEEQRGFLRANWDFGHIWHPPPILETEWIGPGRFGYQWSSRLALTLPGHAPPPVRIRAALISLSLSADFNDFRDGQTALCLIYHAAALVGMNPRKLFEEVAELSSQEDCPPDARWGIKAEHFACWLRGWLRPEPVSLQDFGFMVVETTEGPLIVNDPEA